jgi:RNA polymerase sigma-70 factor, ECF subfamily
MMKITQVTPRDSKTVRWFLEGRFVGAAVDELERTIAGFTPEAPPVLDFAGVTFIDHGAARAIAALIHAGVAVVGCSPFIDEMLRVAHRDAGIDDERGLVAALRRGDAEAFEQIVRRCGGRMLTAARRMLRTEADARDVVQEAFLFAFEALDTFDGDARISTWLHRIVVNTALARLRRQRRKPEASIDELLPHFDETGSWGDGSTPATAPSDLMEEDATRVVVRECIDQLPPTYRMVLILRDVEDLGTEEAAAALGVTVDAMKTRLHRARQALRTLLMRRLGSASPDEAGRVAS